MDNIAGRIELFHILYIVCLAGAGISLFISGVVFAKLKIKNVIGFFTGKQEKREILKIKESDFGKRPESKSITSNIKTEKIFSENNTGNIKNGEKIPLTAVTTKLENSDVGATTVLNEYDIGATTVLQQVLQTFYLEHEITLVHTNEIIE